MGTAEKRLKILVKVCLGIVAILGILRLFVVPRVVEIEKQKLDQGLSFQSALVNYQQIVELFNALSEGSLDRNLFMEQVKNGNLDKICMAMIGETSNASVIGFSEELNRLINTTGWTLMEYGAAVASGDATAADRCQEELRELCTVGQNVLEALTTGEVLYVKVRPASLERAYFYGDNVRQMFQNEQRGRPLEQGVTPYFWEIKCQVEEIIPDTWKGEVE